MVKKVLALAAVLLFATAAAAQAQTSPSGDTYPTPQNSFTADDTSVAPGGAIVLGIQICRPAATASFTLESVALGTATANSSGKATLTATIPSNTTAGTHTITGTCTGANGQPLTQVLSITVAARSAAIPVTGSSNTMPMSQIAIGAIAAGGLLVLMATKRRNAKADTRETAGV